MARAAVLAVVILLVGPPLADAATWRWPVRGAVTRGFRLPAERYGPGGHRGIDIAAAPGTPVRAACPGRVTFAGSVPGAGLAVSVACGATTATYVHLGAISVRRGAGLRAGERLGSAGAARHVHLGARRGRGYVDPLGLLAEPGAPAGPAPAPLGRRPPRIEGWPRPPAAPSAPAQRAPLLAWAGAALLALGVPGLGAGRAIRRRRRARARAVAQ